MKLIEIKGMFQIDYGAPMPTVVSNDTELLIAFYTDKKSLLPEPQERNLICDIGIIILNFKRYLKYSFGNPGNETIQGHPYYKLGMKSSGFYELKDSDLIQQIENIERIHPYYDSEKWKNYKHFIITFHDNMFECIAKEFEISEKYVSMYDQTTVMLNELFKDCLDKKTKS